MKLKLLGPFAMAMVFAFAGAGAAENVPHNIRD
jgi:hypothetical protein